MKFLWIGILPIFPLTIILAGTPEPEHPPVPPPIVFKLGGITLEQEKEIQV